MLLTTSTRYLLLATSRPLQADGSPVPEDEDEALEETMAATTRRPGTTGVAELLTLTPTPTLTPTLTLALALTTRCSALSLGQCTPWLGLGLCLGLGLGLG